MRVGLIIAPLAALALVSCATAGGSARETDRPLYYGYGSAETATGAIYDAKLAILRNVIADLIGEVSAAANRDKLESSVYNTDSPDAYLYADSLETISRGRLDNRFFHSLGVRVNLAAVVARLRFLDIYGGLILPAADAAVTLPDQTGPPEGLGPVAGDAAVGDAAAAGAAVGDAVAAEHPRLSPAEQDIVSRYVDTMTFMVFFSEESDEDTFLKTAAIGIANAYMTERNMKVVDPETLQAAREDRELAYEERTGDAVSLIQWIAQKLDAEIYVEIDAETAGQSNGGSHYGQANVAMRFFDSSTGALLSSVTLKSPRTFSTSSQLDAVNNALQSSIYQAMPRALDQVKSYMLKAAAEGIPFELIIQNPSDQRIIRDLVRRIEARVKKVQTLSLSEEEARYRVYHIGEVEDLQDIVYEAAASIPALSGMQLVYLRGKTITFDSGLRQ